MGRETGTGAAWWRWLRQRWPARGRLLTYIGFGVIDLLLVSAITATSLARLTAAGSAPAIRVLAVGGLGIALVALLARRWRPLTAAAVGVVAVAAHGLAVPAPPLSPDGWGLATGPDGNGHLLLLLIALVFTAAVALPVRRSAWVTGAAAAATLNPSVAGVPLSAEPHWEAHLNAVVGLVVFWVVALFVRRRRSDVQRIAEYAAELERRGDAEVRAAVAEEQVRIARELHDVVAHNVGVMTVQTAAAQANLASRPEVAQAALTAARDSGRAALDGMRALVGALRDEANALPTGLAGVPALVASLGVAGLVVRVHESGRRRDLPAIVDLAAYRIVQESLTNVLRHAGTGTADLTLEWGERSLGVRVQDRGRGPARPVHLGGHGLTGMGERVAAIGGTLRSGARPGAGFEVAAELPYDGRRQRDLLPPQAPVPDATVPPSPTPEVPTVAAP